MTEPLFPELPHPRALAHLGDAVYELFVREQALQTCSSSDQVENLHRYTTARANAGFQVELLHALMPILTEEEQEIVRRGRNVPVSSARRSNQGLYRQATGFEALIGFLYLSDRPRLQALWEVLEPLLGEEDFKADKPAASPP